MKLAGALFITALTVFIGYSSPPSNVAPAGASPPQSRSVQPPVDSYQLIPLKLYWNGRTDNLTATSSLSQKDSAAGYQLVRTEGYVFTKPTPGTVPLKQYWSGERRDYHLTMTAQAEKDALSAGYRFVRIEGYGYSSPQPGTVALNLYWNDDRKDNFMATTAQAGLDATNGGYHLVRTEGYIIPDCH